MNENDEMPEGYRIAVEHCLAVMKTGKSIWFLIILSLFIPQAAMANSMAPVFPTISMLGWIAMPVIIAIEAGYYAIKSINNPIKLSVYTNIASALAGLVIALLTFPVMLGPAIEGPDSVIGAGMFYSLLAIIFHWWFSSTIEYWFSAKHKLWKSSGLPKSIFYKANSITYSLILMLFLITALSLMGR